MKETVKRAWIDQEHRILAFHPIHNSVVFMKEEKEFWKLVMVLANAGYRMT